MDERTRQIEEAWTKHKEGNMGAKWGKPRHTNRDAQRGAQRTKTQVTKLMRDRDQNTKVKRCVQ